MEIELPWIIARTEWWFVCAYEIYRSLINDKSIDCVTEPIKKEKIQWEQNR